MQIPPIGYPYNIPVGDFPFKQYREDWVCTKYGRSNAPWVSTCPCYCNTAIMPPKDIYTLSDTIKPPKYEPYIGDPLPNQEPKTGDWPSKHPTIISEINE